MGGFRHDKNDEYYVQITKLQAVSEPRDYSSNLMPRGGGGRVNENEASKNALTWGHHVDRLRRAWTREAVELNASNQKENGQTLDQARVKGKLRGKRHKHLKKGTLPGCARTGRRQRGTPIAKKSSRGVRKKKGSIIPRVILRRLWAAREEGGLHHDGPPSSQGVRGKKGENKT